MNGASKGMIGSFVCQESMPRDAPQNLEMIRFCPIWHAWVLLGLFVASKELGR